MLTAPAKAWNIVPEGLRVTVWLTPRSAGDALGGVATLADGREIVRARVRAVPENGKANVAAARLLARCMRVPASKFALEAGSTARIKIFLVRGDGPALAGALALYLIAQILWRIGGR